MLLYLTSILECYRVNIVQQAEACITTENGLHNIRTLFMVRKSIIYKSLSQDFLLKLLNYKWLTNQCLWLCDEVNDKCVDQMI